MNYLTNYYKNLAKELQEKLSNLQEQYNALLNEEKKEEKPLAEPSTKEGSEAKRVPLNIKTKKTDPKEEKEKVEKEDMVMKEENDTIAFSLKNAILKIMESSKEENARKQAEQEMGTRDSKAEYRKEMDEKHRKAMKDSQDNPKKSKKK